MEAKQNDFIKLLSKPEFYGCYECGFPERIDLDIGRLITHYYLTATEGRKIKEIKPPCMMQEASPVAWAVYLLIKDIFNYAQENTDITDKDILAVTCAHYVPAVEKTEN